jgi:hypothetical protein
MSAARGDVVWELVAAELSALRRQILLCVHPNELRCRRSGRGALSVKRAWRAESLVDRRSAGARRVLRKVSRRNTWS